MEKEFTEKTETIEVIKCDVEPFTLVNRNGEFRICVGNNLVSDKVFSDQFSAEEYISSMPWELVINVCCFFMDKFIVNNKENEK